MGEDVSGDWELRCDAVQPESRLHQYWHERKDFSIAPPDGAHLVRLDFYNYRRPGTQLGDYFTVQITCSRFLYCSGKPVLRIATSPPQTYNFRLKESAWKLESVAHKKTIANTTHPIRELQMGITVSSLLGIEDDSLIPGLRCRIPSYFASFEIPNKCWSPPFMGNVPRDATGAYDVTYARAHMGL